MIMRNPFAVDIDKQAVEAAQEIAQQLSLEFEQLQSVMFAAWCKRLVTAATGINGQRMSL